MGKKKSTNDNSKDHYNRPIGIAKNRGCTDVLFLLLFIIFWIGMYVVAALAIATGNPQKLLIPQDSFGNYCGQKNINGTNPLDLTDYPYLYYLNPQEISLTEQICIKACPTETILTDLKTAICSPGLYPTTEKEFLLRITQGYCAPFLYKSAPVLNRCIPTFKEIPPQIVETLSKDYLIPGTEISTKALLDEGRNTAMKIVTDIILAKWVILTGAVSSIFICFAYLILIRCIGGIIVWVSLIIANVVLGGFTLWLYFYWRDTVKWFDARLAVGVDTEMDLWQLRGVFVAFVLVAVLAGLMFCVTVFLSTRIQVGVQVIKEAAKAVAAMPMIVLYPLVNILFLIVVAAYFIYIYFYLITPDEKLISLNVLGYTLTDKNMYQYIQWYHIFGCLWALGFFSGICQVTFAGSIATYYWTLDKKNLPNFPIISSLYRTVRYHLGSICLGSIFLAIIQTLRVFLWSLKKQMTGIKRVPFLSCLICCADCCLKCVENFFKWINKQAYIQVAVVGRGFCLSAKDAFGILMRNCLRLSAVNFVSWFVLFLGKISITAGVYFGVWAYIEWKGGEMGLTFNFVPAIAAGVCALVVSNAFLEVYDSAVDTMFICFLEDCERNDGSLDKPYFMSEDFKRITGHKNERG